MHNVSEKIVTFIPPGDIEPQAMDQIKNISEMPFIFKHVAVMPDCHLGKGATVGSVIATRGAIIPAAVGVDIGCGMIAVETTLTSQALPDNLLQLRQKIEAEVPTGMSRNQTITPSAMNRAQLLHENSNNAWRVSDSWIAQLGSLGSGNHFIELCLDERDVVWIVLHSGSRGVGNKLASEHIKIAQKLMERYFIKLADADLAYLAEGSPEFNAYVKDLLWAQDFARLNRDEMMDRVVDAVKWVAGVQPNQGFEVQRINCHHNFTQQEHHMGHNVWITRKGAIQMRKGQLGVIPGSMGTRSYIVEGLENRVAFHSAPHGAGRRFSRAEARRRFTMDDMKQQMGDVCYRHEEALLDEIPAAYKDIDTVMENSRELVFVRHTLKQILNVKGN